MKRPLMALDLFCCSGGASMGLKRAGFDIVIGVDTFVPKDYPFQSIEADALSLSLSFIRRFDFIWASPPCLEYTCINKCLNTKKKGTYPKLIEPTRNLLDSVGIPYCIENVPGAPLNKSIMLCGEMFRKNFIRHRYFEVSGAFILQPPHRPHRGLMRDGYYVSIMNGCMKRRGIPYHSTDMLREAFEVPWITNRRRVTQVVPPCYSEFIGREIIRQNYMDFNDFRTA